VAHKAPSWPLFRGPLEGHAPSWPLSIVFSNVPRHCRSSALDQPRSDLVLRPCGGSTCSSVCADVATFGGGRAEAYPMSAAACPHRFPDRAEAHPKKKRLLCPTDKVEFRPVSMITRDGHTKFTSNALQSTGAIMVIGLFAICQGCCRRCN
jgi:hypothetical protein